MKYSPTRHISLFIKMNADELKISETGNWDIQHSCREGAINRINNNFYSLIKNKTILKKDFILGMPYPSKISYDKKYFLEAFIKNALKIMNPNTKPEVSIKTSPHNGERVILIKVCNNYIMTPIKMSFFLGICRQGYFAITNPGNKVPEFKSFVKHSEKLSSQNELIDFVVKSYSVKSQSLSIPINLSEFSSVEFKSALADVSLFGLDARPWERDSEDFEQMYGFNSMMKDIFD